MTYSIQGLLDYIDSSVSPYHSIKNIELQLQNAGFKELDTKTSWQLVKGNAYYVKHLDSSLIAFRVGEGNFRDHGFAMIGSHSDSPTFRIKSDSDIHKEDFYHTLNVEVYGGPILSSWMDRPLSIAGRVCHRNGDIIKLSLIDIDRDLLIIPNLAIHMNRKVNEGYEFNPQKDTLPLLQANLTDDKSFVEILADELQVNSEDILSFDCFLYDRQPASTLGLDDKLINTGQLDNLAMAEASVKALIDAKNSKYTQVCAIFDHEEIGSRSITGAGGTFVQDTMRRIVEYFDESEAYYQALAHSMLLSADQAHAVHPNYQDKHDPTHRPLMGKGPVIKVAANQSYTSNAPGMAVVERLAQRHDIPLQYFHNPSNQKGGSTIGPIITGQINILSVDLGNPLLAMHSIRELGHKDDQVYMYQLMKAFYEEFDGIEVSYE